MLPLSSHADEGVDICMQVFSSCADGTAGTGFHSDTGGSAGYSGCVFISSGGAQLPLIEVRFPATRPFQDGHHCRCGSTPYPFGFQPGLFLKTAKSRQSSGSTQLQHNFNTTSTPEAGRRSSFRIFSSIGISSDGTGSFLHESSGYPAGYPISDTAACRVTRRAICTGGETSTTTNTKGGRHDHDGHHSQKPENRRGPTLPDDYRRIRNALLRNAVSATWKQHYPVRVTCGPGRQLQRQVVEGRQDNVCRTELMKRRRNR